MAPDSTPRQRARAYLLAHPFARRPEVAAAVGCSTRTAGLARMELLKESKLEPLADDHRSEGFKQAGTTGEAAALLGGGDQPLELKTTRDLKDAVTQADPHVHWEDDGVPIDMGHLKRILYNIVRRNTDDRVRTQAALALSRIQQDVADRPLGPGAPLTRADVVARFGILFEAVGLQTAADAFNAFRERMGYGRLEGLDSPDCTPAFAPSTGAPADDLSLRTS